MNTKTKEPFNCLFEPDINFCSCGCEAELCQEVNPKATKKRKRYIVKCMDSNCGNEGRYNSYPWQAMLDWNKSPSSDFPSFLELPFQRFVGMTFNEIQEVLKAARLQNEQLVKKLKEEKKTMRDPELRIAKVKLMWVIYAQSWNKFMSKDEKSTQAQQIA